MSDERDLAEDILTHFEDLFTEAKGCLFTCIEEAVKNPREFYRSPDFLMLFTYRETLPFAACLFKKLNLELTDSCKQRLTHALHEYDIWIECVSRLEKARERIPRSSCNRLFHRP